MDIELTTETSVTQVSQNIHAIGGMQDLVMQKVDMSDVPGMSPMDIDGVDDQAIEDISTVISLLTVTAQTTVSFHCAMFRRTYP